MISIFFFWGGGGFRKLNIFASMKILWILFFVNHKIGLCLGFISMHLGPFLKVKIQNGRFFWGAQISNIFWGA